ncbi:hypothetical protein P152DRAFT_454161 [Eremomyces bilateralis CBS 781.70]|uniref:Uncharacterized protein n=1 Tax=Eremomyces bilateralis CBS 781.70 TaxID=1392243 RepID=A0A6G1GI91_9PEZI|nr:uncharacterized protein P152DRAFT_454161 [Eremomyces bilateralis CBS 781.70]KAF1817580.1 hypothetical protein P152DRAFT_454161 [Eremomyces bilateralis CBS 781.70]
MPRGSASAMNETKAIAGLRRGLSRIVDLIHTVELRLWRKIESRTITSDGGSHETIRILLMKKNDDEAHETIRIPLISKKSDEGVDIAETGRLRTLESSLIGGFQATTTTYEAEPMTVHQPRETSQEKNARLASVDAPLLRQMTTVVTIDDPAGGMITGTRPDRK